MSLPRYIVFSWNENESACASDSRAAFTTNGIRLSWGRTELIQVVRTDLIESRVVANGTTTATLANGEEKCARDAVSEQLDQRDADQQQRHAGVTQGGNLALGQTEPAVAVDEQRSDLLAGHRET